MANVRNATAIVLVAMMAARGAEAQRGTGDLARAFELERAGEYGQAGRTPLEMATPTAWARLVTFSFG